MASTQAKRIEELEALVASQAKKLSGQGEAIAQLTAQVTELKNARPASPAPVARLVATDDPRKRHPKLLAKHAAEALGEGFWVEVVNPNAYKIRKDGQWISKELTTRQLFHYGKTGELPAELPAELQDAA